MYKTASLSPTSIITERSSGEDKEIESNGSKFPTRRGWVMDMLGIGVRRGGWDWDWG